MPKHVERRPLPFSSKQMYDLVADVERYPEFLPWCLATRITARRETEFDSDMTIGFHMFRETFRTKVELDPPRRIDVTYLRGPFRHLHNRWIFEDDGQGGCVIDFELDFEFRNPILRRLIGAVFEEAVHRMVMAFERRARDIYRD